MKFLDYIAAARPLLHLPVWSIYLVSLHYHLQLTSDGFAIVDVVIIACLTLSAAAAYYLNQVYDYESDGINGKLGFLHRKMVDRNRLLGLYVALSVISVAVAALVSTATLAILLLLFVIGYIYSAPPARQKDRPVSGLLANAFGFGFIVPLAVMPELDFNNAGLLGWDNPLYFFLSVGAIYLLTTIPDREGDTLVGKRTLAVILPRWAVLLLALVLMLLAAAVALRSGFPLLMYTAVVSALPIVIALYTRSAKAELLAAKLPILLLTLLAGYFFPGYLLFIVAVIFTCRIYYKKRLGITYPKLA